MAVGVVVVSHSDLLARGVAELASQMAEGVVIAAAGGADDGAIGTSFDRILAAIDEADSGDGVVVLADLGSAVLTTEQAFEFLDPDLAERVKLADGPIAEGALAAATTAAGGAGVAAVLAAAEAAAGGGAGDGGGDRGGDGGGDGGGDARADGAGAAGDGEPAGTAAPDAVEVVVLPNPLGLHARPAAQLATALRDHEAEVTITRRDSGSTASARSVLAVVALGAAGGVEVEIAGRGPDAHAAVEALADMVRNGFGEGTEAVTADGQPSVPDTPTEAGEPRGSGEGSQPSSADRAAPVTAAETAPASAEPGSAGTAPSPGDVLSGAGVVSGTVIGPMVPLRRARPDLPQSTGHNPSVERRKLDAAKHTARQELQRLADGPEGAIFAMQLVLLDDPALDEAVADELAAGRSAGVAWCDAVDAHEARLSGMEDEVFAARALDVVDIGDRVLRHLVGGDATTFEVPAAGAVVATSEALPSHIPPLVEAGVAGLALAGGSSTSHAAILARNLGLPLVIGLGPWLSTVEEHTTVVLDGTAGTLTVDPDATQRAKAEERREVEQAAAEAARQAAAAPGQLADGTLIAVAANAASVTEARTAVAQGAEGIGLLRTEFLFTERSDLPSEDEQAEALATICAEMQGRPVIVRTLDVGGDKPAPALDLDPVRNGFLGVRGLRLSLSRPDLFRTQLRAILRAAAQHRISLMFPMVTTVDEVRAARAALDDAAASLDADGVTHGALEEIGIMVEVPGAALTADLLAGEVDFFSVGSNDLVAYTMAADRTVSAVADLYQPGHPAILRLIERVCHAAAEAGAWVGVCGEMAADPDHAEALVRLGVRELSMAAVAIPAVKARLREVALGG